MGVIVPYDDVASFSSEIENDQIGVNNNIDIKLEEDDFVDSNIDDRQNEEEEEKSNDLEIEIKKEQMSCSSIDIQIPLEMDGNFFFFG